MSYYAFLNEDNFVIEVIPGVDSNELIEGISPEEWYGNFKGMRCIQTSEDGFIRKNYAGIGFYYNEDLDAFIPPKTYPSWILDEESCQWNAPISMPNDGNFYKWNEDNTSWELITPIE